MFLYNCPNVALRDNIFSGQFLDIYKNAVTLGRDLPFVIML